MGASLLVLIVALVACVSAGYLNDIPDPTFYVDFVKDNTKELITGTRFTNYGTQTPVTWGLQSTPKGTCPTLNTGATSTDAYYRASWSSSYSGLPLYAASRTICLWAKSSYAWNYAANPAGNLQSFFSYGQQTSSAWYNLNIGVNVQGNAYVGGYLMQDPGLEGLPVYNNWQHLCFAYNGTWGILYQNGTQVAIRNLVNSNLYTVPSLVWFGYAYGQTTPYLQGQVSEVLAWNSVLTPQQIRDIYNYNATSCTPFFRPAVPAMRLDMTNDTAREVVTQIPFSKQGTGSTCGVADTPIGKCGVCNFTGSGYLLHPSYAPTNFSSTGNVPRTVCAWAKSTSTVTSANRYIYFMGTTSNLQHMYMHSSPTNNAAIGYYNGGYYEANTAWPLNTWSHICHVNDLTSSMFYVNGTYISSLGVGFNYPGSGYTILGGWYSGAATNNWVGQIANVVGFNSALTSIQVNNVFKTQGCDANFVECFRYGTNFVWLGDRCGCQAYAPNNTASTYYPSITSTSFTYNTLNVVMQAPWVTQRIYSATTEGASGDSCNLGTPTSYWNQTFQNCNDTLTFKLPWLNRVDCGFNLYATDSQYFIYKGKILMSYTEMLTTLTTTNTTFNRTSTQSYEVYIQFAKSIQVKISNFTVWSVAVLDFVYSGELYDANNKWLNMSVDSILPWSSAIDPAVTVIPAAGINLFGGVTVAGNGKCEQTYNTMCTQRISFAVKIADPQGCQFNGQYRLNGTIWSCRNGTSTNVAGCVPTKFAVSFNVASGSICTTIKLEPPLFGDLSAYYTNAFDSPLQTFSLTETAYFRANVNAGNGNTVSLTFLDITFLDTRDGSTRYLLNNQTVTNDGKATGLIVQGDQKYFALTLARSVFSIPLNKPAIFTFTIRCEAVFTGNKKRILETTYNAESVEKVMDAQISIVDRKAPVIHKVTDDNYEEDEVDIATVAVIAAAAGLVALVVGIAGAAYYFKGRYAKYAQVPRAQRL